MPDHYELISERPLSSSKAEGRAEAIGTGERVAALCCAGILAVAMLAGACGEDPQPMDPVDAAPGDFAVRGTATGVLGPVALELRQGSDVEPLTVTQEGAFAFKTRLETGASYTVVLVDPGTPCTLSDQTGVIMGADAAIELTCTGPSLASVVVSGIAPEVTLVPGTTAYVVDLPLSQSSVTLTATVTTPGDTLAIEGTPVASGTPSAEIPVNLGDNRADIVVENAVGWQRTYRLTLRRAPRLAQYAYGKASNTGTDHYFGWSVALAGDTLAVGAQRETSAATGVNGDQDDDSAPDSGAVYVFRRTGTVWRQEAYLKASNTGPGDAFGWSVALAGDTLAVGATNEDSGSPGVDGNQEDNAAQDSGAVYVFRRTGTSWQQEAYVKASTPILDARFGHSVALTDDTLAVGAVLEEAETGAVYVFRRTGASWQEEARLLASNAASGDQFGHSVALAGDTLAVGAYGEASASEGIGGDQDDNSASCSGAVYVFGRVDGNWQQEAYVKASNPGAGDSFGTSVALAGDTLAVGAYGEASTAAGVDGDQSDDAAAQSGAVYVFGRTDATWQQRAYVKASNPGAGDFFGATVALSGDTLAVGAGQEDSASQGIDGDQSDNAAANSGAVYVFH